MTYAGSPFGTSLAQYTSAEPLIPSRPREAEPRFLREQGLGIAGSSNPSRKLSFGMGHWRVQLPSADEWKRGEHETRHLACGCCLDEPRRMEVLSTKPEVRRRDCLRRQIRSEALPADAAGHRPRLR